MKISEQNSCVNQIEYYSESKDLKSCPSNRRRVKNKERIFISGCFAWQNNFESRLEVRKCLYNIRDQWTYDQQRHINQHVHSPARCLWCVENCKRVTAINGLFEVQYISPIICKGAQNADNSKCILLRERELNEASKTMVCSYDRRKQRQNAVVS